MKGIARASMAALIAALALGAAASAEAPAGIADATGDWRYTVEGGFAVAAAYVGEPRSALFVPAELDGLPVIGVGGDFLLLAPDTEVVFLPEGVEYVGDGAFRGCPKLLDADLRAGLKSIGEAAFQNCGSMLLIELPEGLISIGARAFANCGSMTTCVIPASVGHIGEGAFDLDGRLTLEVIAGSYAEAYAAENGIPYISSVWAE